MQVFLANTENYTYLCHRKQNKQDMKRIFHFVIIEHPFRLLATVGLLALAIHWGFLGFVLLSVPMFAIWESVNF